LKALIIGYGSIGKRHYQVLSEIPSIKDIHLVTKQDIKDIVSYKSLYDIKNLNKYDYFVIASETNKHFKQLKFLDENVQNKIIFCEKPLFETRKDLKIKNNKVFVGYVLRYHPILQKLKNLIKDEKIIIAKADCGQYLPTWRPDRDYRKSYSTKKEEGGGVLLDLSHEIDYIQWLCGQINDIKSYQVKISDLEINSDDLTMLIGKTTKNVFVNISIDYISKLTHREFLVETMEHTYKIDFIKKQLVKKDKTGLIETYKIENLERNYIFKKMHLDTLGKQKYACTFEEGLKVMNTISIIQEENK